MCRYYLKKIYRANRNFYNYYPYLCYINMCKNHKIQYPSDINNQYSSTRRWDKALIFHLPHSSIDFNTIENRHPLSLVRSTGEVIWVPPVKFRIHCQADMTYWPFDTQTGVLKIGSWVHSSNVINLTDTAHEVFWRNSYFLNRNQGGCAPTST